MSIINGYFITEDRIINLSSVVAIEKRSDRPCIIFHVSHSIKTIEVPLRDVNQAWTLLQNHYSWEFADEFSD